MRRQIVLLALILTLSSCRSNIEEAIKAITLWARIIENQKSRYFYLNNSIIMFPKGNSNGNIEIDSICSIARKFPVPSSLNSIVQWADVIQDTNQCLLTVDTIYLSNFNKDSFYAFVESLAEREPRFFIKSILDIRLSSELDAWTLTKYVVYDTKGKPLDSLPVLEQMRMFEAYKKMANSVYLTCVYNAWIIVNFSIAYTGVPSLTIAGHVQPVPTSSLFDYYVIRDYLKPYEMELKKSFIWEPDIYEYDNGLFRFWFIDQNTSNLISMLEIMKDTLSEKGWIIKDFITLPTIGSMTAYKGYVRLKASYDFAKGKVLTFTLDLAD